MRNHFLYQDVPWAKKDIGPVGNLPEMYGFGGANLCSAFDAQTFDPQGQGTKGNIKIATYKTTADSLATVEASGYFSSEFVATTLVTGDRIVVDASDGSATYRATVTLSTTTVAIEKVPSDQLVTSPTTAADIPSHGHVLLPSTAAVELTIAAPVIGEEVSLIQTGATTTITTVLPASTAVFFGNASNRLLSFNAIEEAVILKGQSATRYDIISNVGSVAVGTT